MPGMNGIELLKSIRASGSDIPFIIFTGRGREEVIVDALNAGADFYLQKGGRPKPQYAELSNAIRHLVEKREAKKALMETEELRKSEMRLSIAQKVAGLGLWDYNLQTHTLFCSDDACRLFGYEPDEINPSFMAYLRLVHPDDREELEMKIRAAKQEGASYDHIHRVVLRDGGIRYIHSLGEVISDEYGKPERFVGTLADVTERKNLEMLLEDALARSDERYRNVVEAQTEFVCRFLPDGTHVFVNEAYCTYFGKKRDDIIGQKFVPQIPPEDKVAITGHFQSFSPEHPYGMLRHRSIMPNGEIRWQNWSDRAIFDDAGTIIEYQSVGRDITDMVHTEETLYESGQRMHDIIEFLPDATFAIDQNGVIIAWNEAAERLTGVKAEAMLGKGNYEYAIPFYGIRKPVLMNVMMNPDRVVGDGNYTIIKEEQDLLIADTELPDLCGRHVVLRVAARPFYNKNGEMVGAIESIRDITERREAREALQKSEHTARALLDSSLAAILLLDRDGKVLDCNGVYPTRFTITRKELIGQCIWDFFSEEDARWRREEVEQVFVSGESIRGQTELNGKWSDYVEYPVFAPDGAVQSVTVYAMDITDLKRAEAAVKETNKKLLLLSSITRHDILNNVSALLIYESLMEDAIAANKTEEMKEDLKILAEVTERIEEQITFTRDYEALGFRDPIWQNCNLIVEKAAEHVMVEHLDIDRKCSEIDVFADPMFGRVFWNIFDNALRHGGEVTEIRVRCLSEGNTITLMVEDNGKGVADEMKETIFHRGVGSNTGYGLFLAKEILEITGISISETGVLGEGARFTMTVPNGTWRFAQ